MEPTYRLSCPRRFAYSIGHVLNDMCASMWFSYLLLYFHYVLNFNNDMAGYLMLLGQVADAIATPLIGYESDKTSGCCRYTKRKSWHLLGTICVGCSFVFLFMTCPGCEHSDNWAKFIYYAPFIVIFQFGWASTQISHLSLIPELTPNESERVELNAIRYAFTVTANLLVYVIAWLLLNTQGVADSHIGPEDMPQFRTLAVTVVAIGAVFSLLFHLGVEEPKYLISPPQYSSTNSLTGSQSSAQGIMIWKSWLKELQFYQIAAIYMCTRLIVNLSQIYLPLFLTDSLQLSKEYIAIVPLVVYVSGFITSIFMRPINKCLGRKLTYLTGLLLITGSCVWMWFIKQNQSVEVIGPAVFLGAGSSTLLVTSLSMTADLIGRHNNSGAFVYGAMSFTDKLSNGIAVLFIQNLHPCVSEACCAACVWYYRDMMVFVPGGVAIVAFVLLLTLIPTHLGKLKIDTDSSIEEDEVDADTEPLLGEDSSQNSVDCCDYFCCLWTSKDAEAHKIACSCRKPQCRHRARNYQTFSSPATTRRLPANDLLATPSINCSGDLIVRSDYFDHVSENTNIITNSSQSIVIPSASQTVPEQTAAQTQVPKSPDNKMPGMEGDGALDKTHNIGQNKAQNIGQNEAHNTGQNEAQNIGQNEAHNTGQNEAHNTGKADAQNIGQCISEDLTHTVANGQSNLDPGSPNAVEVVHSKADVHVSHENSSYDA